MHTDTSFSRSPAPDMLMKEIFDLARHMRGCALFAEGGVVAGYFGVEAQRAIEDGRALLECFAALGVTGDACFAASLDIAGGQVIARTFRGRLLVVRTDGAVAFDDASCEALITMLSEHEDQNLLDSAVRVSSIVTKNPGRVAS